MAEDRTNELRLEKRAVVAEADMTFTPVKEKAEKLLDNLNKRRSKKETSWLTDGVNRVCQSLSAIYFHQPLA